MLQFRQKCHFLTICMDLLQSFQNNHRLHFLFLSSTLRYEVPYVLLDLFYERLLYYNGLLSGCATLLHLRSRHSSVRQYLLYITGKLTAEGIHCLTLVTYNGRHLFVKR